MSRMIEDRLASALEARAEQVTAEALRPLEVPEVRRHPRTGVLLLAAAATAAVVAAPFVLAGDSSAPGQGPAGTPSGTPSGQASATPSPSSETDPPGQTVTAGLTVVGRQRADVDGDGRPDRVQLMTDGTSPHEPGAEGRVEVRLASGTTVAAAVPAGYAELLPPFSVSGDGREQVLVSHSEGGDSAQLLVYTWNERALALAEPDGDAPLALELDGQGKVAHYTVGERGLVSWLRQEPVEPQGWPWFTVRAWSWRLDGTRLVPSPAGSACVDATASEPPGPCPAG